MLFLLNIGNTHAQPGIWNGKMLKLLPRIPTAELRPDQLPADLPVAAATVVPETRRMLDRENLFWLTPQNASGCVNFNYVDSSTLGADRVANAVALAEFYPLPALVVDCGTAITLEIVDAERVFRGGAIAPGRRLMRRALAQETAQLPEIPFSTELPERAGNGTVESIRFGVDRGAVGLVRELVEAAAQPYGGVGSMRVIATGGDAPFFAAALPFLELAPEEFTHHGIRLAGGVL